MPFINRILLFTITCILTNSTYSQQVISKTPIINAVYSNELSSIDFLWEDSSSSNWEIDIANNINFISNNTYLSSNNSLSINTNTFTQDTYYWRVRNTSDTSGVRSFNFINLNNLGDLIYYINAQTDITSSNGKVSQWENIVNPNYNATETNSNFQPELTTNLINNHDFVKFGGNDGSASSSLSLNDFLIADSNYTLITCIKQISFNSNIPYILGGDINGRRGGVHMGGVFQNYNNFGLLYNNPSEEIRMTGVNKLNWEVNTLNFNKTFKNSISQNIIGGNAPLLQFNTIGVRPDNQNLNFHGYLGDIIIYNEVLPDSSRLLVENYLKTKYTPYPDLGKDTTVCGTEIKIGFRADHGYSSRTWSTGATNVDSINITQNGWYWIEVESFGWTLRDSIFIDGVVPVPQISISNDLLLCYGDSIQVNYSPVPDFTPTWSNGQTTDSIIVKDSSQFIQVSHSDINNCTASSITYFATIDSLKLQSTLGNDRNVCDGGNIYFETTSNQGPFEYDWSTGDTTSFTNASTFGVQDIYIEVSDFNSCIFKDTVQINAVNLPAPIVNFNFDTVCPNLPTHFVDLSTPGGTDNIIDWKWTFINNDSAFVPNTEYTFTQGTYNISLTIETDSGCINTIVKQVRTHKQPIAKINTPILCAQGEGIITSNSIVPVPDFITNYNWLVDNNNYTSSNPNVLFTNDGMNDVELIVISDKGCTDTTTKTIEVFPTLLPDFKVSNICIGDSIQFNDITPSFSVIEKEWRFGILNETSTEENPKFLYPNAGTYDVKLSVKNAIGCSNYIEKTIEIHELPTASAIFENTCVNDKSLFIDASTVNNGFVNEMTWTINGNNFIGDSAQFTFDTISSHSISHSIIDNFGCVDDTTFQIQINELPDVDFTFSPNYGTAPLEINFSNQTLNAIDYTWDFGDNSGNSIDINPTYTYTDNGVYNIVLSATNQFACSNSKLKQLIVAPTDLDLEISNLSFTKTTLLDGSIAYTPSVLLKNVGTRFITNVDLYAAVDNETKVAETWTGSLGIGQAFLYEFTSYFVIQNDELLDYICVSGNNVNDNTETNLSNNKTCQIQKGVLQTSPLYPNPTNSMTYMDVVSKNKGTLMLDVYDMLGKRIFGYKNINLEKGYNQIAIDCVTLQAGTYYVNLTYLDEAYTQKLVITNQ